MVFMPRPRAEKHLLWDRFSFDVDGQDTPGALLGLPPLDTTHHGHACRCAGCNRPGLGQQARPTTNLYDQGQTRVAVPVATPRPTPRLSQNAQEWPAIRPTAAPVFHDPDYDPHFTDASGMTWSLYGIDREVPTGYAWNCQRRGCECSYQPPEEPIRTPIVLKIRLVDETGHTPDTHRVKVCSPACAALIEAMVYFRNAEARRAYYVRRAERRYGFR